MRAQDRPQQRRAAAAASTDEDLSGDVLHGYLPLRCAMHDRDVQLTMEAPLLRKPYDCRSYQEQIIRQAEG